MKQNQQPQYPPPGGNGNMYMTKGTVVASPQQGNGQDPVEGVPLYKNFDSPETKKFVVSGYKDIWAAVGFLLCMALTIGWGSYNYVNGISDDPQKTHSNTTATTKVSPTDHPTETDTEKSASMISTKDFVTMLIVMVIVSCVSSFLCLLALCKWPKQMIIVANVGAAVLQIIFAIVAFSKGLVWLGVLMLIMGVIGLVWLYLVRHRIPFSALLLNISANLIGRYKSTVGTNYFLVFVFTIFCALWGIMMYPVSARTAQKTSENSGVDTFLVLFFLLIFFWASQVTVNVMHVTASGLAATWYYVGNNHMPENPVFSSFKRASTTSFGSICFGSLLVAVIRLLRTIAEWQRDSDNGFIACIVVCLLRCLESIVEYFNEYAFVHVAIYGCGYIEAAKRTWALVKQCFWAGMFNDCLVGTTLTITSLAVSLMIGIVFGLVADSFAIGLIAFFISLAVHSLTFRSVESCVTTIFVCFAETPEALAASSPELHAAIHAADQGATQARPTAAQV